MRQIESKRKGVTAVGKRHQAPTARGFNDMGRIEWWRRIFLPADFASQASLCQEENLECRKLSTEYLTVKESHKTATIKAGEARTYHHGLDYHPREFRNQRITFIEDEEKLECNRCKGKGKIDCSPEVRCPSCKGRRTRVEFCFTCGGSGRAGQDQKEQCWSCRGRGTRSEDCGACAGVYSGSTGRMRCNRCGGSGWVVCRACAGAGEKVRGKLITRDYSFATEHHFQMGELGTDQFRGGLAPRHFKAIPGNLVRQDFQQPGTSKVVLQRLSVFSYAVESKTYSYKSGDFYLNRISSGNGDRFVATYLPWSRPKLGLAGILAALAVGALSALPLLS